MEQMAIEPRNPSRNCDTVCARIEQGFSRPTLMVFPELAVPGYLIGDFWERAEFLKDVQAANATIAKATNGKPDLVVAFGTVCTDWNRKGEDGRPRRYNAVMIARDGQFLVNPVTRQPFWSKTLLPNYREFEETRYFYDNRRMALELGKTTADLMAPVDLDFGMKGLWRLGFFLCEDGWWQDYEFNPAAQLVERGAQALVNLSCSPFTLGKQAKRDRVFGANSAQLQVPTFYVNSVGLQNNGKTVFAIDGQSTVYSAKGAIVARGPSFAESSLAFELSSAGPNGTQLPLEANGLVGASQAAAAPEGSQAEQSGPRRSAAQIFQLLEYSLRSFMSQAGIKRVVIGASGGIDSSVAAALFARVVEPSDLLLVNMPSRFNSEQTKSAARELATNLGCRYIEIPIEPSIELTRKQIGGLMAQDVGGRLSPLELTLSDFALENVQARDRSSRILAAVAAAFGGVFTCNGNKAEITVGYSTLYGDHAGFLAPLGDLWKHEVYELGRYLNDSIYKRGVIPEFVFGVKPSAELSAQQDITQGLGDPLHYPYHDFLFRAWMQRWNPIGPEETLRLFLDGRLAKEIGCGDGVDLKKLFPTRAAFIDDLERYWKLFCTMAIVKRVQSPPIVAVSQRAFGFDYREALGTVYWSKAYLKLRSEALAVES
jgi:NAD+ synthase (glutamine-hydrolysing)